MPQKSLRPSIQFKPGSLPEFLYRQRFIIVVAVSVLLLLAGCKKSSTEPSPVQLTYLQQYFEDNILNRDFTVKLATDNGTNITAQFNGYLFRLTKSTLLNGPMTATNGISNYNGTWSSNDDYSKLTISFLASPPPEFGFINREWKFTKKTIPVMELAPWGTTEPKVLHMERQ